MQNPPRLTTNELALFARSTLANRLDPDKRDMNVSCGYPDYVSLENYWEMYERHDYAARVVSVYPAESWSAECEVYESEGKNTTAWERAWIELISNPEHQLISTLARLDEISGIGRYGGLLIGIDDGRSLSQPADGIDPFSGRFKPETRTERGILFFRTFDERFLKIDSVQKDTKSPRLGMPETYSVVLAAGGGDGKETRIEEKVHWTRMVHFAENGLTYHTPRMQQVYNRLLDVRKVLGSSAEMFWQGAFPGFTFTTFPELATEAELDKDSVKQEVSNYRNGMERFLSADGGKFESLAPQVADPTPTLMQHLTAICATKMVPLRIFLGSESGHLASTQDSRTWNRRMARRQREVINPRLLLPVAYRLAHLGCLPMPVKPLKVDWSDLNSLSEAERADVGVKRTQALMSYVTGRVFLVMDFKSYLLRVLWWSLDEATACANENKELLDMLLKTIKEEKDPLKPMGGMPQPASTPGQAGRPVGRVDTNVG